MAEERQCRADLLHDQEQVERDVLELRRDSANARLIGLNVLAQAGEVSEREYASGTTSAEYDRSDAEEKLASLRGRSIAGRISACQNCPEHHHCERSVASYRVV